MRNALNDADGMLIDMVSSGELSPEKIRDALVNRVVMLNWMVRERVRAIDRAEAETRSAAKS